MPTEMPLPVRAQQTQNICIAFIQHRPNVFDAGPTLYKYFVFAVCDNNT